MSALLTTYLPALTEVPAERVQETRNLLSVMWGLYLPDIDIRANSVLGDSLMVGASASMTALDIAVDRFRSDMDPEQVGQNIIYDCPFVERFLANFGVYAAPTVGTSGFVRLVFNAAPGIGGWELPRHLRFRFSDELVEFQVKLTHPGPLLILAPGLPLVGGVNGYRLVQVGPTTYATTLCVEASESTTVDDGATGVISQEITGLQSITALGFSTYPVSMGLPALARKSRVAAYAATPSTANGIRRFAELELPGVLGISSTGPGDVEQLRASFTTMGFPKSAADIYVRGQRAFRSESQVVRLDYDPANSRFVGKFFPISPPLLFNSVVWEGNEDLTLDPVVWMRSPDTLPGVLAAGSGFETYFISLPMPTDDEDADLIQPSPETGGSAHAWFVVTYQVDDEVLNVRNTLSGNGWKNYGVDVMVLPFRVVEIFNLHIQFRRKAGTRVVLDTARDEIYRNINALVYPHPINSASWIDSMFYAGADVVTQIRVAAECTWCCADRLIPAFADPTTNYTGAMAASLPAPFLDIATVEGLTPVYTDPRIGLPDSTFCAVGPRNIMWRIRPESITFEEIQ